MLAALRFVDYVTLFSDRTPQKLIRELRPDVVV
jgi:bifunctional ADP-heptose synthase (sugar kinase/adenylyltransferase)